MWQVVENDLVAAKQADRNLGSQDLSRQVVLVYLRSVHF